MFLSNRDIERGELTKTVFEGSPSFIIEIVSPNYLKHDTVRKLQKYQELGVREYWILDPELHELRQFLFEEQSISETHLYTEEVVSPNVPELSKIGVNLAEIWELIKDL